MGTYWREQGIPITKFFDDGVGAGSSLNSVKINSSIGCADLSRYGLEINEEKSNWEPERNYLGKAIIFTLKRGSFSQVSNIDLNEACSVLEASAFIHVKKISSIVNQITLITLSCRNVTQIMTSSL